MFVAVFSAKRAPRPSGKRPVGGLENTQHSNAKEVIQTGRCGGGANVLTEVIPHPAITGRFGRTRLTEPIPKQTRAFVSRTFAVFEVNGGVLACNSSKPKPPNMLRLEELPPRQARVLPFNLAQTRVLRRQVRRLLLSHTPVSM